jgi:hypothetical protein
MAKAKQLDNSARNQIMQHLLMSLTEKGKPAHGIIGELATKYSVSKRTISRLWAKIKAQKEQNQFPIRVNTLKAGKRCKPPIPFDEQRYKNIPKAQKTSIYAVASAMNVSKSTVWRWKERNIIRKHTNAIKPLLNDQNKLDRLIFCLCSIAVKEEGRTFTFSDMSNVVHIDEKLFYLTRTTQNYYLTPQEQEPHREIQSKRFIPKIMFMCAVAKPIYSSDGDLIFDGKIGIFPFTMQAPAQRSSKNRRRGEMETKPIQSITKQHTRDMIIQQILPSIRAKWPQGASKVIYIQQDNAKPHITDDDTAFREVANIDGFEFHLVQQPPNSPDLNVLDLGFFRSIQALQHQHSAYNYKDLVTVVQNAYDALTPNTLKFVWVTLQACKIEVLKKLGGIDYHIPHMNKTKLAREGLLPEYLSVNGDLIFDTLRYLDTKVDKDVFDVLLFYLGIKDHSSFHHTSLSSGTSASTSTTQVAAVATNTTVAARQQTEDDTVAEGEEIEDIVAEGEQTEQ